MIISSPGKLFIAGEWAILEPGNPGIVVAINKRTYVNIKKSADNKIHIKIKDFNIKDLAAGFKKGKLQFEKKINRQTKEQLSFIKSAIEIALKSLPGWKPFEIETTSKEMSIKRGGRRQEIGLGSSAAIAVATVAGVLKFHGINIKRPKIKNKIYKLSALAHYFTQGKIGSGFDVAASTFGGIFLYKRFNPDWLSKQIKNKRSIRKIINLKWPGLYFENLKTLCNFHLIIGWTREPASTSVMVRKLYKWREKNGKECKKLFKKIAILVKKLTKTWRRNNKAIILNLIKKNEEFLRILGKTSEINIETQALRKMSEIANKIGGAGKLSGAGGGDCGIAIAFDKKIADKIKKEWRKINIKIIDANISMDGVREDK